MNMRLFISACLALLLCGFLSAQKQIVAVMPLDYATSYRVSPANKEEFAGYVAEQLEKLVQKLCDEKRAERMSSTLTKSADEEGYFKLSKDSKNWVADFQKLHRALGADLYFHFRLEDVRQKNDDTNSMLSDPSRKPSETKIKVRIWVYSAKSGTLLVSGKDVIEAAVRGPYFGTTDKTEIGGGPNEKGFAIRQVLSKRAEFIARAMIEALNKSGFEWPTSP